MDNKMNKSKKEDNKYVLLEKPMFFNSKLNKDENKSATEKNTYKDIIINSSLPSNNNNNSIIKNENKEIDNKINNNNNNKKESPKKEMKI